MQALPGRHNREFFSIVSFRLAHLSDAHIGPLPDTHWRELLGKRFTGFINWQRRNTIHNMNVLAQIVADIRLNAPDHVAMTGDVMNIALPNEFTSARDWLKTLGEPVDVSFVPGNHDAYVRRVMDLIPRTFAPWCSSDGDEVAHFPYLRVRGEVALIGLSSAIPTAPFLASGNVGVLQMAKFAELLQETAALGLCRVVMIHHPPWQGGASFGRGLRDASAFERVIARHGAELILHGHNHRLLNRKLTGPDGPVPCIGVASASAVPGTPHHQAAWHLFEIERKGNGWNIRGRGRGFRHDRPGLDDLEPIAL